MSESYVKTGTLKKPGIIGRVVRLVFGLALLQIVYEILQSDFSMIGSSIPNDTDFFFGLVFAFWLFPEVINIGWSLPRGNWPRVLIIVLAAVAGVWGLLSFGRIWAPPLGWLVFVWFVYTFSHLGIAFVLSSILSTPGCEMRSIPQLWGKITGNESSEHFCPGVMDTIDKWESRKN